MRVDVIPQLGLIDDKQLGGKIAVVIDLLRATSTMATAIENGARCIVPVEMPGEAEKLAIEYQDSILAGEREGVKIKGFTLGNSPLEFTHNRVNGKIIIHCTSNGTRTVLKCKEAEHLLIGSMLNRAACLEHAAALEKDIVLVCSGRKNGPAREDSLCAGAFIKYLRNNHYKYNFSKLAMECYYLYKTMEPGLHDTIYKSPSGINLISMGLKVDIDYCLRKDVFQAVPVYSNGIIENYK